MLAMIMVAILGAGMHDRMYDMEALQHEADEWGYEIHLPNGMVIVPRG